MYYKKDRDATHRGQFVFNPKNKKSELILGVFRFSLGNRGRPKENMIPYPHLLQHFPLKVEIPFARLRCTKGMCSVGRIIEQSVVSFKNPEEDKTRDFHTFQINEVFLNLVAS